MIAWGKLNGTIKDFSFKGQHIFNIVLLVINSWTWPLIPYRDIILVHTHLLFYFILVLHLLYGVLFVFPIGGADMPVVISLLKFFYRCGSSLRWFLV